MALSAETIAAVFHCILTILFGLALVHHGWIYYQLVQVSTPSLQGRYSRTVLLIIAFGIAFHLIYQPFLAIADITGYNHHYSVYLIHNMLAQCTSLIYPFVIAYRSWMIYYQIKWNIAMEDTEWSQFIDTHSAKNWFLRYYEYNKKYTWRAFVFIWIVLEIPALFVTFIGEKRHSLLAAVYSVQYFFPALFLAVLLCKIPRYDDVFFIRNEIKLIVIAFLAMAVLYGPVVILRHLFLETGTIILKFWSFIGPFCILFTHLYFPLRTFHLPQTLCALQRYRGQCTLEKVESVPTVTKTTQSEQKLSLREVLALPDGFNVFARHMNKEFAIENLLFLLEIDQFQQKMIQLFGDEVAQTDDSTSVHRMDFVNFPEELPKSTLILNLDADNVHLCLAELFAKYIIPAGYFTINIGYESRVQLYALFAYSRDQSQADILANGLKVSVPSDWNRLYHLFDEQRMEVYRLLLNSFARFKQLPSYQRLMALHSSSLSHLVIN